MAATQGDMAQPGLGTWGPMRSFPRTLLLVLAFDTAVAALFGLLIPGAFAVAWVEAQAVGLGVLLAGWALHGRRRQVDPARAAAAIVIGGGLGILAGRSWEMGSLAAALAEPRRLVMPVATLLLFGSAFFYWFHLRATLSDERVRRAERERELAEERLKLLQAQIEPHFLFNTLSNVLQLVEAEPQGARRMLLDLTRYLRASLDRTRAGATTLGEELELLQAYLRIQAVRMGPRLAWRIECPEELRPLPLPPLLLQPVVENAVRHGLDPLPEGGEILVAVARQGSLLRIEVADTGLGLATATAAGIGLANVRGRVHGLTAGRGRVVIQPRHPRGLSVRLELPLPEGEDP